MTQTDQTAEALARIRAEIASIVADLEAAIAEHRRRHTQ